MHDVNHPAETSRYSQRYNFKIWQASFIALNGPNEFSTKSLRLWLSLHWLNLQSAESFGPNVGAALDCNMPALRASYHGRITTSFRLNLRQKLNVQPFKRYSTPSSTPDDQVVTLANKPLHSLTLTDLIRYDHLPDPSIANMT
jgi:hypothetical protein